MDKYFSLNFCYIFFFDKIRRDFNKNLTSNIKQNLIIVGALSYLFLSSTILLWYQLMIMEIMYLLILIFSSFYFFTALHGIHLFRRFILLGKVTSKIFKLQEKTMQKEENINVFLFIGFLIYCLVCFFAIMFVYNDAVIAFCKSLIS